MFDMKESSGKQWHLWELMLMVYVKYHARRLGLSKKRTGDILLQLLHRLGGGLRDRSRQAISSTASELRCRDNAFNAKRREDLGIDRDYDNPAKPLTLNEGLIPKDQWSVIKASADQLLKPESASASLAPPPPPPALFEGPQLPPKPTPSADIKAAEELVLEAVEQLASLAPAGYRADLAVKPGFVSFRGGVK